MTQDARFEDAREAPLNLGAQEAEDVQIISALAQDAVLAVSDISWQAANRRLILLLNRFRWEHDQQHNGKPERVRALLVIDNVQTVSSLGIDRTDKDLVLSLLEIAYAAQEDGAGVLTLTLAGDGAIRVQVEALELTLKDVTRPYSAPSGKTPDHGVV